MAGEFKCTLLREKFVLQVPDGTLAGSLPVTALSNRLVLSLSGDPAGEDSETFIIRTQNMHSCVRLSAAIAKEYLDRGAITKRASPFRWENLWRDVIKGYEKDWNADIWCAIYYKGRVIYEDGARHPFLDIIEKCDAASGQSYADSVTFAEQAFQQAGQSMKIDHDSNIALIVTITPEEARCGVILRGANRKTTFNFTVKEKKNGEALRLPTILTFSAAFLEGVQLAFNVGLSNRKRSGGLIEKYSDEDRKSRRSSERLINLGGAIEGLERKYIVQYRPDRPDFQAMTRDAESFAGRLMIAETETKLASGQLNPNEWLG